MKLAGRTSRRSSTSPTTTALMVLHGQEAPPARSLSGRGRSSSSIGMATPVLAASRERIALPLTAAAMVLLATPVSAQLGSRRGSAVGVNLAVGALIGIGFYLGSQILFALGTLLGLPPLLVALLPALAITACAVLLLRRMHW